MSGQGLDLFDLPVPCPQCEGVLETAPLIGGLRCPTCKFIVALDESYKEELSGARWWRSARLPEWAFNRDCREHGIEAALRGLARQLLFGPGDEFIAECIVVAFNARAPEPVSLERLDAILTGADFETRGPEAAA